MPAAEIAVAVTSIRSALDIVKAMIGLRDAEAFRAKSIELQGIIAEALGQVVEAREAQAAQLDRVRALEAEVAQLKAWNTEKEDYEIKSIGQGAVARILKPDARGTKAPHWLCPNCFEKGQKSFLQSANKLERARLLISCANCPTTVAVNKDVNTWAD
jgi:hypothetical protein